MNYITFECLVEMVFFLKIFSVQVERILFQQAECIISFDLYKIVFCFQIYKGKLISEHTRMKPKILSMQGWFK